MRFGGGGGGLKFGGKSGKPRFLPVVAWYLP
jgi:hypothetical protein